MNEAIKLAIEKGGYAPYQHGQFYQKNTEGKDSIVVQIGDHFTLDPLFWQALGKALGWGCNCQNGNEYFGPDEEGDPIWGPCTTCVVDGQYVPVKDWLEYAHQYFDLLLTGDDTEKFWKELLK